MPAPKNPWIARHRIICSIDEAKPHRKLAMVKPEAEIANSNRVPNARDRNPDSGIAITSAIRYEVWTHDTSVELADRPAWISLSDAETTWMSRIDMNIPNTMMRNANSRRGEMRSDGTAAALIIVGGAAVASAIICSAQDVLMDRARRPMRNYCGCTLAGASSSASLSASAAPFLVSTVAYTDMPARSRFCLATSFGTRMRTGSRCTILVKVPVALYGGSRVNTEPAAGELLS